jgi:hypothetical protein
MMKALLATGALAAVLLAPDAGRAQEYPWCVIQYDGDGGEITTCGYVSVQQCRDTIWGVGGYCRPNPLFGSAPASSRPPKKPRHPS